MDRAKVAAGPWLTEIPEPEHPLNEVGRKKYDDLTKELLRRDQLTLVSAKKAEAFALLHQKIEGLKRAGRFPSANDLARHQRALMDLDLAENYLKLIEARRTREPEPILAVQRFVNDGQLCAHYGLTEAALEELRATPDSRRRTRLSAGLTARAWTDFSIGALLIWSWPSAVGFEDVAGIHPRLLARLLGPL